MRIHRISVALVFCTAIALFAQTTTTATTNTQNSSSQKKNAAKDSIPMDDSPLIPIPPPAKTVKAKPAEIPVWLTEMVKKQFGSEFEVFSGDPQVLFTGDFDGDGVEDAAIVVRAQHPMAGMVDHNFKAFSPEEDYYGFGDPKVFTSFPTTQWHEQRLLVVLHGAGAQAWRAETPKAKFLIVNVPFIQMSISKITWKKHVVAAIIGSSMSSTGTIFWDGKKYKFLPTGTVD